MYQIDKIQFLQIGVQGENDATNIEIDMTSWVNQFPDAVFHILFKPYNASAPSPMLTTYADGVLTWTVGVGATAVVGVGYTEVRAQDASTGLIKKSRIIPTSVDNSVSGVETTPPASYQEWVTDVLNAGTDAKNSAAAAMAYSQGKQIKFEIGDDEDPDGMAGHLLFYFKDEEDEEWEDYLDLGPVDVYATVVAAGYTGTKAQWIQSIQDAEANAQKSEKYAVGKVNGTDVGSTDPTYHNNSKYYSEQAAGSATDANAAKVAAQAAQSAAETAAQTNLVEWLEQNITNPDSPPLDRTLSSSSAATPADITGDLKSAFGAISDVLVRNLNALFVDGRYAINQNTNRAYETTGENRKRARVSVLPKCVYRITFTSQGTNTPVIMFTDKFNTVLGNPTYGEATGTNMVVDVVAPDGAAYLFVTHATTGSPLIEPSISQIVNIGYVDAATAPSNTLIDYFGAGMKDITEVEPETAFSGTKINTSGKVTTGVSNQKVTEYIVESGKTYRLYGTNVKMNGSVPIACFGTSAYNGTDDVTCSIMIIDDTSSATETNYNVLFTAPSNGYIYVASYASYNTLTISNTSYGSTLINELINDIEELDDNIQTVSADVKSIVPPYNYSFDDLFENMESSFIDDFVNREAVVDTDHVYTVYGDDTGANAPSIITGTGIIRTGASGMSALFYSRPITAFPYYCLIGLVDNAQMLIKLYRENSNVTDNIINIGGATRGISYGGQNYGNLHKNAVYAFLCIDQHGVTLFDDAGVRVYVPAVYTDGLPKNIAFGFGTNVDRLFGYGAFVEFVRDPLSSLDFNRCVSLNRGADSDTTVKAAIRFTHSVWNNGAVNSVSYVPEENPYMELATGLSNNPCIKCVTDYTEDAGYRTEIGITPIRNGSLNGKFGGLQRFKASADYYMSSEDNVLGNYYTYIFQLHNSNFIPPQEWPTDPPPLTVRITPEGRLMASVTYVANGAVPADDNVRTVDTYDLGAFEMDKWMHLEVEARIGWNRKLAPKLIIRINGQERLNIDTPIGFNIISLGGYVNTHFGVYCPEWHERAYDNTHREMLITNIKWAGTQYIN